MQPVADGEPVIVLEARKMKQPVKAHRSVEADGSGAALGMTAQSGAALAADAVICETED